MASSPPPPAPSKTLTFARRTSSTLGLWALVGIAFASRQPWAYLGLIAALAVLATLEFHQMARAAKVPSFPAFGLVLALGYSAAVLASFLSGRETLPAGLDSAAVFLAVVGAFTLQLRLPIHGREAITAVAMNVLGFLYISLLFHFVGRLLFLVPSEAAAPGWEAVPGAVLLIWLVAVTKFTDMGAYLTGSWVGKHKMIPHVSPGKTWEGFAGALVFAQLAGCGLYFLFPGHLGILTGWRHVIGLGVLLALLAVIGDLAESVLKRALGAKDSGKFLPGIGGSLDLIDSLCFTAPALFFYLQWMHHTP